MKPINVFEEGKFSDDQQQSFNEFLLSAKSQNLNTQVIKQLFLKPYLPAIEICREFEISKAQLEKTHDFIRSSKKSRDFFADSPYSYLVNAMGQLSKDAKRTLAVVKGEEPLPLSDVLELFVSNSCNANCKFCYRNDNVYHRRDKVLSTSEFVQLINDYADLNGQNLVVSGGLEPLLSCSLLDVLKTGIERKLNVQLYTNGIALGEDSEITEQLMKLPKVRISLNASNRENYKEILGVDKFDRVIENLRYLVETKRKSKSSVRIGVGFAIFRQNYSFIPEALELAQKLELDFVDLRFVEKLSREEIDPQQKTELRSVIAEVRQKKMRNEYGALNVTVADTFNSVISPGTDCMKYVKKDLVKELWHFRITVTPHGRVYALNLIGQPSREDNRFLIGKIGQNDLSAILRKEKKIPYDKNTLLAHDITLMLALSKLTSDLEYGISLEENPFCWE